MRMRTFLFTAVMASAVVVLGGCEWMQPRVTSPISGKAVTANELTAEADARQNQLEREKQQRLDDAAAAIRAAKTNAQIAIGEIQSQQTITAAQASAEVNTIVLKSEGAIDAANASVNAAVASFDDQIAALSESVNASLQVIQRERSAVVSIAGTLKTLPVVGQALGSAGVDPAAIVAGVLGIGAVSWQARNNAKTKDRLAETERKASTLAGEVSIKADAAYEDGAKAAAQAAEVARQREHAAWDEATRAAQAEAAARVSAAAGAQQSGLAQVLSLLVNPDSLRSVLAGTAQGLPTASGVAASRDSIESAVANAATNVTADASK